MFYESFARLLVNRMCSGINRKFALESVRQALRGRVVQISLTLSNAVKLLQSIQPCF